MIVGFDNHKPKGHHMHIGTKEELYAFKDVDSLIEDFWNKVIQEGFFV